MKRFWSALVGALLVCACSVTAAHGTVTIRDNPGGNIEEFVTRYDHLADTREPVIVDGYCNSACTLMTGILPKQQVCVTPRASFGFHSAFYADNTGKNLGFSPPGTRELWSIYPPKVRAMLRSRGWNGRTPHPNLITIEGTALYRPCA